MRKLFIQFQRFLFVLLIFTTAFLSGCVTTGSRTMGQAAIKNFETRTVDASINAVFTAATEALFDLGYIIKHSDRQSGLLVGERQDARKGERAATTFWFGYAAAANVRPVVYNLTLLIKPTGDETTDVRIKTSVDGEPKLDKKAIDQVWLYIERQVLMESGPDSSITPKEGLKW